MSGPNVPPVPTSIPFDPTQLPLAQLESLKFKAGQIYDSIQTLKHTLDSQGQPYMPAWPDILSKYNILLSQSHNFASSLSSAFERIALHPNVALTDAQLDDVIQLLRNQQTNEILKVESATVRRLQEHIAPPSTTTNPAHANLESLEHVKSAHDARVERAVRAVTMLRERYEWRQRVEVEVEEPEEVDWIQDQGVRGAGDGDGEDVDDEGDEDEEMDTPGEGDGDRDGPDTPVDSSVIGATPTDGAERTPKNAVEDGSDGEADAVEEELDMVDVTNTS
ncbi:hypothetical protein PLICRDRAFT_137902 [Plicaturopsis crispa FD-325 SS-3]|nr:hypothetical protein PLICRDRAFT_137902 [Plicaturopsis crispa FD-325 SS-3]